jgi:hypothetical protein
MKRKIIICFIAALSIFYANVSMAQTREFDNGINYQAVIRDGDGNILANQEFTLKFIFSYSGSEIERYSEEHIVTSDDFGIVNLVLLKGTYLNGTNPWMIDWPNERVYITTFVNNVEMGYSLLTDVPYAKFSEYAENLTNPIFGELFYDVYVDYTDIVTGSLLVYDGEYWTDESNVVVTSGTGNMGIGVLEPTEKLEVDGNVKIGGEVNRNSTGTANMVPIAYGMLNADGTVSVLNSTANITATKEGTGVYHVTIADETFTYFGYVPSLTALSEGTIANVGSVSGKMIVKLTDHTGTAVDGRVYFVIYKL